MRVEDVERARGLALGIGHPLDARERRLTALPKAGANVLSAVSAMIDKYDWDVPELHLESGRLDEVFRALTDPKSIDLSSPAELGA